MRVSCIRGYVHAEAEAETVGVVWVQVCTGVGEGAECTLGVWVLRCVSVMLGVQV